VRIPGGFLFTIEEYWIKRHPTEKCRHCGKKFEKGDAVVSKNRTTHSWQYCLHCALFLNIIDKKDVEKAIKKGEVAASALAAALCV
jgi:hypothetical protein